VSGALIAAKGLQKRFGAVVAANDVSVDIAAGKTVGIIGANGAGKTTFINMVTGYLKPDQGAILFKDTDITRLPPRDVTRLGVRRSFQVAQLFPNLSIRDNILIALASSASARPDPMRPLRTVERIAAADAVLQRVGLAEAAERSTVQLPQGQRKLLDIAMAMVGGPTVLLLDEPTSGISAEEKFPIMDFVMERVAKGGTTVLFIEHDMELVERYAARVLAFYEGRIIADGPPQAVLADADVRRYVVGTELHRRPGTAAP
jgi:branched-chain amino acid transport system ATP-binding protein